MFILVIFGCGIYTKALNVFTSSRRLCEPKGRGNLAFLGIALSSRMAGLLAMTIYLMRLFNAFVIVVDDRQSSEKYFQNLDVPNLAHRSF